VKQLNEFQNGVIHALGWVAVLFDGWVLHVHWLALIGFVALIYSMWRICDE
jgi:hypothetical protein